MRARKHVGTKAFFLAFLLSMAILGSVSACVLAVMGLFENRGGLPQSVNVQPEYQPVESDNLTLLLMLSENDITPPDRYMLLRFSPTQDVLRLVPVPTELESTVNVKTGTLPELYEYGGTPMVCSAVENAFSIHVDRYIKTNRAALEGFIDIIGGVEYEVEQTVEYQPEGAGGTARLVEGFQLLGGTKFLQYLYSPLVTELSQPAQMEKRAELFSLAVTQRWTTGLITRSDALFEQITNTLQTNLTNYDYTIRKRALQYFAGLGEERTEWFVPEGTYRQSGKKEVFDPSAESKSKLKQWFEPLEE